MRVNATGIIGAPVSMEKAAGPDAVDVFCPKKGTDMPSSPQC